MIITSPIGFLILVVVVGFIYNVVTGTPYEQ